MQKAFDYMSQIGFLNSVLYALAYILFTVVGAVLQIVWEMSLSLTEYRF
ncbi:hypothetical protein [Nitrosomonas aestuarii]|nr:hypothetical protein [Nitrosomonas aestuarii]